MVIKQQFAAFKPLIGNRNGTFPVSYCESNLLVGGDLFSSLLLGSGD